MKIALMTSGTIKGSLSYRPLAFAKELVKMGHDVYIFAPRFDKYSKFKDEKITEIEGVKIVRPLQIRSSSFELGLIPYIFSSLVLLHKINPDVVDIYKSNPITIIGLILKFTLKKKVIFSTDDIDSMVVKLEKQSYLKIKLVEFSEKLLTKYSDAIITGSIYLKNIYSLQYKNKVVSHIPNGAEFDNPQRLLKKDILNNRIIFIGNINRSYILEPLFISLKNLKDQKLRISTIIIGDGEFLDYFKDLSKKFNLNRDIKFLGRIPQDKLYKHVKVGDIGYSYMPNEETQKACSNMKVFQYMQYGVVPVVSNVGDLPSYTFHGKAGYIAKHSDIKSLTESLKEALLGKKERLEKIRYALVNAKKKYSWNILAQKVEQVYIKI